MLETFIGYVYELLKIILIFACVDKIIYSIGAVVIVVFRRESKDGENDLQ